MKQTKTVTDAVRAANRANAKSSTGPRTEHGKFNSCRNALRHGILAKKVVLKTDEELVEFQTLFQRCKDDFGPKGLLEKFFMEEIAILFWKLRTTIRLETKELSHRHHHAQDIDGVFRSDLKLPIGHWDLPLDKGWECERIVVRAVVANDVANSNAYRNPTVYQGQMFKDFQKSQTSNSQDARHLEVEAVLGSSLDNLTRYQSALKRDLYRAIEMLRSLQAERRHREGMTPDRTDRR